MHLARLPAFLLVLAAACTGDSFDKDTSAPVLGEDDTADSDTVPLDADGDGSLAVDDCDDDDASAFPGGSEACDGVDNDCDGTADEDATDAATWYADADADGFGSASTMTVACDQPPGYAADGTDCDDANAAVRPDAAEACDALDVDEDCDGLADDADLGGALAPTDWYRDTDEDGYGAGEPTPLCEAPAGYVALPGDCDDDAYVVNPGALEKCSGRDEDCDGETDEAGAEGESAWYTDTDLDGFGDPASAVLACSAPPDTLADGTDCDDADALVYPGAPEWCDGVLNDCSDTSATYEDNVVSRVDTSGVWTDVSALFTASSATAAYLESGTYYFCAGTYYTKLVASSDTVDVVGVHGADVTILANNSASGAVVSATNGAVNLSGLTLSEGKGGAGYGGGLLVAWTSFTAPTAPHVTVDDCVISDNDATNGGGVALYGESWVAIDGSVIEGNTATEWGGGVYLDSGAILDVVDTTIDGNTAAAGGGVFVDEHAEATLVDTWVSANVADTGGGFFLYESDATMDCASTGGVIENTGGGLGGGVFINPKTGTTTFTSTTCDFGSGATDNTDDDIEFIGSYDPYVAGASATFVCVDSSCTP